MSVANPKPAWKVTLDGVDLTGKVLPRLVSLSITSAREEQADQLDITLADHDGRLDIPPRGALLHVWLGWDDAITDMGTFTIDEIEHSGLPDQMIMRGRSAHLRSDLRTQREVSYRNTTVGAIVDALAGRNGLTPRCHPSLASLGIAQLDQTNESDINLLTRLGKRYDATATIKAGALIFAPIGKGTTATGKPLPRVTLTRADGDQHRYHLADRDTVTGVRATWHDDGAAKKMQATVGEGKGHGVKTLRHSYSSEEEAKQAAAAEYARQQRGAASMDYTLARGRADIYPEMHLALRGWKPPIDATDWLVVRVEHRLDESGFTTAVQMQNRAADNPQPSSEPVDDPSGA